MIERIANQSVPIRLGYAGENEVLRVGFDLTSLKNLFPGGHPLLEKLNGIAAEANKYVHPTHEAHAAGFYKVTVDAEGHVTAVAAVEKADITGLGIPGQDTTYEDATQEEHGLMSVADKTKLDGMVIATDAEVTEMLNEVFSATT